LLKATLGEDRDGPVITDRATELSPADGFADC
jgi:hypothetical protein